MQDAKPDRVPLGSQFTLSAKDSPKDQLERDQKKTTTYASAIGILMYAMVSTRPYIAHAVGVGNPGKSHWEAVKWILRYLRGTTYYALCYSGSRVEVAGFVDADLASSDVDNWRSTTGYVFTVGGTAVSCMSKLQKIGALSPAGICGSDRGKQGNGVVEELPV